MHQTGTCFLLICQFQAGNLSNWPLINLKSMGFLILLRTTSGVMQHCPVLLMPAGVQRQSAIHFFKSVESQPHTTAKS